MKPIHWHEGLFLHPHHLQQMQRGLLEVHGRERRLACAYPYGVVEAKLSDGALKDYWVRYDRLRVVMPYSGLEVRFPENTDLAPRNIRTAFASGAKRLSVYLALPLWSPNDANTLSEAGDASTEKRLYSVVKETCPDENTGSNPQELRFRKLRARLLLEGEDDLVEGKDGTGLETFELLRVERDPTDLQAAPRADPGFVPASLLLNSSPPLWCAVRDLKHEISSHRDSLAQKIKQAGFSYDNMQAGHFEKVLRLRTLNRACARLSALLGVTPPPDERPLARSTRAVRPSGGVSPFVVFAELSELLGELEGLRLGHTDYGDEPFDHDDPYACFDLLCTKIRAFLVPPEENKPLQVEFKLLGRWPTATLEPAHLALPNRYFLGIRTDQDSEKLAQYVENSDRFKLLSAKMVEQRTLVEGLRLKRVTWVPPNLPGFKDLYYFQIDIMNSPPDRWNKIREDSRMSIWRIADTEESLCGVNLTKATFTLYMTVPPKTAA